MPKTQTRLNRPRSLMVWFGRHKVLAVVVVLILISLLYWAASAISWKVQVHAERQRYEAAANDIDALAKTFPSGGQVKTYRRCSYTSNGAVFATRSLGCLTAINAIYPNINADDAQKISDSEQSALSAEGVSLRQNSGGYDENDLAVYTFSDQQLNCGLSATYYEASVPSSRRYSGVPSSGSALFVDISCSGPAKAEYFPVTQD